MDWLNVGFLISILSFQFQTVTSKVSSECTDANKSVSDTRILSRRKRFLVFPDGTSLQLVFCCQTPALIPIGDIFLYGNTAALAWTLPSDPEFLLMFKDKLRTSKRRQDINEIYYFNEDGKVVAKVPYKRKPIINPAFAKRSADQTMTFKKKLQLKLDRKRMHEEQERREYLKMEHMNDKSIRFHRSSRVGLYGKLEKLYTALGQNGQQCVLYKLCEAAKRSSKQGTFLQELARIVFTLPKGAEFDNEEHKQYDRAHHHSNDECSRLYPGCEDIVLSDTVK